MELNQEPSKQDTIDTAYQLGQLVAVAGDFYDLASNVAIGYRDAHLATGEDDSLSPAYTGTAQIGWSGQREAQPNSAAAQERRRRHSVAHWRLVLGALNELQSVANNLIAEGVGEARADGLVWSEIGDALEMSRQGAHKRFGSAAAVYNEVSSPITEI